MSDAPEVLTENVIQVRFSAVGYPQQGVWKAMTEREVDDRFHSEAWLGTVATTMVDNTFQILSHHFLSVAGHVEARYITIRPAF